MLIRSLAIAAALAIAPGALVPPALAQDDDPFADATVETVEIAPGIFMLATGLGGNMGLCVGEDGAFLIDDQFAPLTPKILAAVAERTDQPVEWVLNTHWHGDHTGGNENMGEAGAVLVAHENVRERLSTEQFTKVFDRTTPPSPEGALPVVTFTDVITFHWNGQEIRVEHIPHAHTDGDAVIRFIDANVIHCGDVLFNRLYPYIDVSAGGSIDGLIAGVERLLEVSDAETKFIPGHGEPATRDDLVVYLEVLKGSREAVKALVDKGMSREETIAAAPTAEWDEDWGWRFIGPELWVGLLHDSLSDPAH